ncbi:MAG TPA: hypothetical protein VN456_07595, partial [Desulfosporosinus sp.]|nr:hypothetical protein [Desulfosporosinus sp.]
FMVLLTGRIGKINIDFNIRDKGVPRETEVKNFPHAILDGTFNRDYQLFRDFLIDYGTTLKIPPKSMLKKMDSIFSDFLINFLGVPRERVIFARGEFDLKNLEIGMKQSWVWPH